MKKYVVVPTYNESANIQRLIERISEQKIPDLTILVVDDHSPDGTSELVSRIASKRTDVVLVERVDDKGRGTAGIVGFDFALKMGADAVAEMDADFSHPPEDLKRLFENLEDFDIVIASRLASGAVDKRPWKRRLITKLANAYVRFFLELPSHRSRVKDWTTGFRAYKRRVFEMLPPRTLISRGPSILQEILFRALNSGARACEIPFQMMDREKGVSTFNARTARQSLLSVPFYKLLFGSPTSGFDLTSYVATKQAERHFIVSKSPQLKK